LQPGDEILTTDHEYGAMDRMWEFITHKTGARYVHRTIPLPVTSTEEFVEHFWAGVTERTKVVYLSHVTSPTALIFPVAEICRRAAEAGLISIVDGAHAPGQIPLNLAALGADVYVGACHKWLCAPKGSAFLYARPEAQQWLEPLVISRGWGHEPVDGHSPLVAYQEGQGTRDPAAFLAVPAAIQFQADHDWDAVRRRCHALAAETRQRINALTGLAPICPDGAQQIPGFPAETGHLWFGQFVTIRLPDLDPIELHRRLYEEHRIEVPVYRWNGGTWMRVSFQGYNDQEDVDALVAALERLLPELSARK
jgi:isopenicillin-N epimerase